MLEESKQGLVMGDINNEDEDFDDGSNNILWLVFIIVVLYIIGVLK